MAITPAPGYIVDPNNPNGVIRDPNAQLDAFGKPVTPTGTPIAPAPPVAPNMQSPSEPNTVVAPKMTAIPTTPTPVSPDDQKLLDMGITKEQLAMINSPQGMDNASFQNLIGQIEIKLKTNNDLVTQRGYLIKHLYDAPLTPDQLAKLPPDIQQVVNSGNKDAIELQLRLLNDQIAGRANTLTESIGTLTTGYQTAVADAEKKRQDAIDNVLKFVQQYGSSAPSVLKSLYGQSYMDQLKAQGIDIAAMSTAPTISENRYNAQYGSPVVGGNVAGYDLSTYATAPGYSQDVSNIAKNIGPIADAAAAQMYISQNFPNSPITGDMVMNSAKQFGVDPTVLMSILQKESQFATDGSKGATMNNPGNVGNSDSAMAAGRPVANSTMQSGIDAVARWLAMHPAQTDPTIQAYVDGIKSGTVTSIAQVPARYKNAVAIAMQNQGVASPLGDRRYTLAANAIIANYIALPEYQLTANALPYMLKIDAAKGIPGSVSDQELLDSFTKLSTAGGVITDAQVSVITGGRSLADTLDVYNKKLEQGGVLSDDQRQQIFDLAQASYKNLKAGYQPIYDEATKKLQASQIPEQFWTLPDLNTLSQLSEDAVNAGNSGGTSTTLNFVSDLGNKYVLPY